MKLSSSIIAATIATLILTGCGDGNWPDTRPPPDNSPEPPPPSPPALPSIPNEPPYAARDAGIWISLDDWWFAELTLLLINDRDEYRLMMTSSGVQGLGGIEYGDADSLSAGFYGFPPLASPPNDWGRGVSCAFDGSVIARSLDDEHIDAILECEYDGAAAAALGLSSSSRSGPMYRFPVSDQAFDIGQFEGTWTDARNPGISVVNIDSLGIVSGQQSTTSCIYEGRIFDYTDESLRTPDGLYDIEWFYRACAGDAAIFNGVRFEGLVFVSDWPGFEQVTIVATGYVADIGTSLYLPLARW